jgi:P pilus assembly chaperone PapD
MRRLTTCAALCAILFAPAMARAAIIINELSYDDTGTDQAEFVELYNSGPNPVDISGWTLIGRDSTTVNPSIVVPAATSIPAGGYYLFGSSLMALFRTPSFTRAARD